MEKFCLYSPTEQLDPFPVPTSVITDPLVSNLFIIVSEFEHLIWSTK